MPLSSQPIATEPNDADEAQSDFEKALFSVFDQLLSSEKEQVHQALAAVLTHMRDASLSHGAKIYALAMATCFLAHMEVPMEVPHRSLQRVLARAYADLQAAIAAGEVPAR